jgi:hypothetical protein
MGKSIALAVVCGLAALIAANGIAFAQAGSTGGTLGKTDKSASGGEESRPHGKDHKSTIGSCQKIVGS